MGNSISNTPIYTDFSALQELRTQAQSDQGAVIKEVSKQFEAIFSQLMLKSMREANAPFSTDESNSDQIQFYQSMYDQQLTLQLSHTNSMGLADVLAKQLQPKQPASASQLSPLGQLSSPTSLQVLNQRSVQSGPKVDSISSDQTNNFTSKEDFITQVWPEAQKVAAQYGLNPKVLLAQAALESGWGNHVMRDSSGALSYNLFGIKADKSWEKESVTAKTLEFRNGVMQQEKASFRRYTSFSDSFSDYAHFLMSNPRYKTALSKTNDPYQFTRELQKAGYATDPNYADKINAIMDSPILKRL